MYICIECKKSLPNIKDKSKVYSPFRMYGSSFKCAKCSNKYSDGFEVTMKTSLFPTNSSGESISSRRLNNRQSKRLAHKQRQRVNYAKEENIHKTSGEKRKKTKGSNTKFKRNLSDTTSSSGIKCLIDQQDRIENPPEESKMIPSVVKLHKCNERPSAFKRKNTLTALKKKHNLYAKYLFKCKICNRSYNFKSALELHQIKHTDSKPHQCKKCNKTFKYKSALKTHMNVHDENNPFVCEICNMTFLTELQQRKHLAKHHKPRPHQCNICCKTFKVKSQLKSHMLTHNVNNPFKCEICNQICRWKSELQNHMIAHSNVRSYECSFCSSGFKRKADLTFHRKKH